MTTRIGVAAGFGHHAVAIGSTVLTLLVLTVLNIVEKARKVAASATKD